MGGLGLSGGPPFASCIGLITHGPQTGSAHFRKQFSNSHFGRAWFFFFFFFLKPKLKVFSSFLGGKIQNTTNQGGREGSFMQSPDNILLLLLGAKKMMMILAFLMPAPPGWGD